VRLRLIAFVFAVAPLFAQNTAQHAEKIKDIKKLMVLMEAEKATNQMFDQMAEAMRTSSPNGEAFLEEFRKEMTLEKFMEIAVASYDKYLTHDDIRQMIRFYESPVGRRLVEAMPKISTEMANQSMALSKEIADKVLQRVKDQH
jgi:hypothetical protein